MTWEAAGLLRRMVAVPSPSFEEEAVCTLLCSYLEEKKIPFERIGNNIIAEHIAEFLHVPLTVFRPDYARFQRRAPLERNRDIVQHADYVIALWDGSSRGTAHAIEQCIKEYKPVRVLLCRGGKLIESVFDQSES